MKSSRPRCLHFALFLCLATAQLIAAEKENEAPASEPKKIIRDFEIEDGKYRFTIDATIAPDLMEWATTELAPVVQKWYPKIIALLPSPGFEPATNITIRFRDDMGGTPASAGGGRINCNAGWFKRNL